MGRMFRTEGVRGIANMAPMTAEMVLEIGRAMACEANRFSRTQSMCRVMVKGPSTEGRDRLASEWADTVKQCIG